MTYIDENTSRADLEAVIISEDALYRSFDEKKLLDGGYTDAELLAAIREWIEAGDECGA